MTRAAVLSRLQAEVAAARPLVIAGVGTGLTARSALRGGADLLVAYHSAPQRLAGLPSIVGLLPVAEANALVRQIAGPILRAAAGAPVLATACAADATTSLTGLRDLGFAGIMTAPTAILIEGPLRAELEREGLGFAAELALITTARELDLVSCAYARTAGEACAAAAAGADLVVAHLGTTRAAGANDVRLQADAGRDLSAAVRRLSSIAAALRGSAALLLCHGGPLDSPAAVHTALRACPGVAGSFGASVLERLPIERAVREATAAYKQANRAGLALDGTR